MADIYDEIFSEEPAEEVKQKDVYDDLFEEEKVVEQRRVQSNINMAAQKQPDKQAEYLKIAKELDQPLGVVERNYDSFKRKSKVNSIDYGSMSKNQPATNRWLQKPNNASIGHDDLDNLQAVENMSRFKRANPDRPISSYLPEDFKPALETGVNSLAVASIELALASGTVTPEQASQAVANINAINRDIKERTPNFVKDWEAAVSKEGEERKKAWDKTVANYDKLKKERSLNALIDFSKGSIETVGEVLDQGYEATIGNPKGLGYVTIEQLVRMSPAYLTSWLGIKAGTSAAAIAGQLGPQAALPEEVVTVPLAGIVGGRLGYLSGAALIETGSWIQGKVAERVDDPTDPEQLLAVYSDPKFMAEIRAEGLRKGVTTAVVDTMLNTFAGRFLAKVKVAKPIKEATGVKETAKAVGKASVELTKAAGKELTAQTLSESASEAAGQAAAFKGDIGKIDFNDVALEGFISVGQSSVDIALGTAGRVRQDISVEKEFEKQVENTQKAQAALEDAQQLQNLNDLVEDSKVNQRDSESFGELIDFATEDGAKEIYFQDDEWDSYWTKRGESPAEKMAEITGDQSAYHEAKKNGVDLQIPLKEYVTKLAGTDDIIELNKVARTDPGGMNLQEAREHMKELPGKVKAIAQEAEQELTAEQELAQIKKSIERQLVENTGMSPGAAKINATLLDFFRVQAERLQAAGVDVTVQQLFDRYGLTVTGEQDVGVELAAQEFSQEQIEAEQATPEFKEFFKDSKVVDDKGKPITLYHGTKRDFEQFKTGQQVGGSAALAGETGIFFTDNPEVSDLFGYLAPTEARLEYEKLGKEYDEKFEAGADESSDEMVDLRDRMDEAYEKATRGRPGVGGRLTDEEARTVPVHLNLKNPYRADMKGGRLHSDTIKTIIENIKKQGEHDGVIFENVIDTPKQTDDADQVSNVYVAFQPEQIKSIFNLKPTRDPRILFQSGKTAAQEQGKDPDELGYYSNLENQIKGMDFKTIPPKNLANQLGAWSVLEKKKDPETGEIRTGKLLKTFESLQQNEAIEFAEEKDAVVRWAGKLQIKEEEIIWTGILDYLAMREAAGEKVSKDEMQTYMKENGVKISQHTTGTLGEDFDPNSNGYTEGETSLEWQDEELTYRESVDEGLISEDSIYDDAVDRINEAYDEETGEANDPQWNTWVVDRIKELKEEDPEISNQDIRQKLIEEEEQSIIDMIDQGGSGSLWAMERYSLPDLDITITGNDSFQYRVEHDGTPILTREEFWNPEEAKIQAVIWLQEEGLMPQGIVPQEERYIQWKRERAKVRSITVGELNELLATDRARLEKEANERGWSIEEDGKEDFEEAVFDLAKAEIQDKLNNPNEPTTTFEVELDNPYLRPRLIGSINDGWGLFFEQDKRLDTKFEAENLEAAKKKAHEYMIEKELIIPADKPAVEDEAPVRDAGIVPDINRPEDRAQFRDWSTRGGFNYRELWLTLPNHKGEQFTRSHSSYTNNIAHLRTMDRWTTDNKKILHVDEIQSDWHQKGRDLGYQERNDLKENEEIVEALERNKARRKELAERQEEIEDNINDRYRALSDEAVTEKRNEVIIKIIEKLRSIKPPKEKNELVGETVVLGNGGEILVEIKRSPVNEKTLHYRAHINGQPFSDVSIDDLKFKIAEDFGRTDKDINLIHGTKAEILELRQNKNEVQFLIEARSKLNSKASEIRKKVPLAPFKSSDAWASLAFKRALSLAIQENHSALIITPGKIHAKRYSMRKRIDSIKYKKTKEGKFQFDITDVKEQKVSLPKKEYQEQELPELFGKSFTEKFKANEGTDAEGGFKELKGDNLEIDDQGHIIFYDTILAKAINKMLKGLDKKAKLTVKKAQDLVGENFYDEGGNNSYDDVWYIEITDKMRESVRAGQTLFQEGKRGKITIGAKRDINIQLLEGKDPSTFLHEMGHFYLEALGDMAEMEGAPQEIKDDYQTILDFLGVESRDQIETKHHEQFARSFEAFLMEGKAPSAKLRKAFTAFKTWLISVYKEIRNLDVNLTDEVRDVMSRLLASEVEIQAAQDKMNLQPLFGNNPESFGLKGKKAQRYRQASLDAKQAAEDELTEKLLEGVKQKRTRDYKKKFAKEKEAVTDQVEAMKIYKSLDALKNMKMPDGSKFKLSKESLLRYLDKEELKKLKGLYSAKGGVDVDVAASMLGYDKASEFIEEAINAPKKSEFIDKLTESRMVQKFPDLDPLLDQIGVEQDALLAIHNDKREKLLELELEHLATGSLPALKDVVGELIKRPPKSAAVRKIAKDLIAKQQIKNIRPVIYERAEAKAARLAAEALQAGDRVKAFEMKQKERINYYLYKEAMDAKQRIEKGNKSFRKFNKKDEDLAKVRDINFVNAGRSLLARFGISRAGNTPESYLSSMKAYDPEAYDVMSVLVESVESTANSIDDMTYDEYQDLKTAVDSLWQMAKQSQDILIDGKRVKRDQAIGELTEEILKYAKPGDRPGYKRKRTDWENTKLKVVGFKASLRRVESWVDTMDMGKQGVFRKYIWNPISEASDTFRSEQEKFIKRYLELLKPLEKGLTDSKEIQATEIDYTFQDKAELLGAMLHTGNNSNLQKLLRGRNWGEMDLEGNLDRSKWDAFVTRMIDEGALTKQDFDFIQSVWDLMEELKPMAQKAHKDMYGHFFDEVTANEFENKFGKYKGGYFPAKADPNIVEDAAIRQDKENIEKFNNNFAFPTTGRGATKKRVEQYAAPLIFDLRQAPQHIDWALRFSIIEPRVKDVAKVVNNKGFREVLAQLDPTAASTMLVPWLQRAASQRVETPVESNSGFDGIARLAKHARTNTGFAFMVGNIVNTLQQFTGFSITLLKVKPKYLRNAMWTYITRPKGTIQDVAEKSEFMNTRVAAQIFDITQRIDDLILNPTKYEQARTFARQHGYIFQAVTQSVVDNITWVGAYEQALEQGDTEKVAVRKANSAVRLTQGSFNPEDISRMESGTAFHRLFTMFYSYFNMQANILGSEFTQVMREYGVSNGKGRLLYIYTFGFMVPAVMSEMIIKAMSGQDWDEDDDDRVLDDYMSMFFQSQLRTGTAMVPFVGQFVQVGINSANDKWYDDRISTSPAVSVLESSIVGNVKTAVRAAEGKDVNKKKAVRDALTAINLGTGLPVAPLSRPIGYLIDVEEGKAQPSGPIDFTRGLITGKSGE